MGFQKESEHGHKVPLSCAHPWHGVSMGDEAPDVIVSYIEIVPQDLVKYELDKATGLLRIDRPQKYSNYCPSLYGLVPKTYCGRHVGDLCASRSGRKGIIGDGDPLDICVLSEKTILRSGILVEAIPIGGFCTIDRDAADDKVIAVLKGDLIYGNITDISECPKNLIERLYHYFLTYKERPGSEKKKVEIVDVYGRAGAHSVIQAASQDYIDHYPNF